MLSRGNLADFHIGSRLFCSHASTPARANGIWRLFLWVRFTRYTAKSITALQRVTSPQHNTTLSLTENWFLQCNMPTHPFFFPFSVILLRNSPVFSYLEFERRPNNEKRVNEIDRRHLETADRKSTVCPLTAFFLPSQAKPRPLLIQHK